MILSDFILTTRQNQILTESGIDSKQHCLDRKHFDTYPHTVEYRYNSRGFRDNEWPESMEELKNCIWCFGDSFTVGIGSPIEHTWVNILQQKTGIRCINISMDGASNAWIARKINLVLEEINPRWIVVQWSYLHRTESTNTSLPDEVRRKKNLKDISIENQLSNFKNIRTSISDRIGSNVIVESFIPRAFPIYSHKQYKQKINMISGADWPDLINITLEDFNLIDSYTKKELDDFNILDQVTDYISYKHLSTELENNIIFVKQIDFARDGHHYDYLTAVKFVDSIIGRFD